jgi:polar amino acid transport system substrate-binding protein
MRLLPLLFLAIAWPARSAELRLVADEWLPYNGRPGAAPEGYMIDLARRIAADGGDRVEYRTLDWRRALDEVRAGRADCAVGANHGDADDLVFPVEPWGRSTNAFFVRTESRWNFHAVADLKKVRLGVVDAYSYGPLVDGYLKSPAHGSVVRITDSRHGLAAAFAQQFAKKVDVVVDDKAVALALIDAMDLRGRVRLAGDSGEGVDIFLACSPALPSSAAWVKRFDEGVRKLRDNGGLGKILKPYGLNDWIIAR